MPHGTETLLLQLFTIFVWAKAFGEIFERLRLPAVLGEILAGVVLGPFATRLIEPSDTIVSMAEIGAIFLLFSVGLETSPKDLIKVGRTSLNVALAISDRAIFLEKGEVKFEGSARDLMERDDLARAVFFGTEGG